MTVSHQKNLYGTTIQEILKSMRTAGLYRCYQQGTTGFRGKTIQPNVNTCPVQIRTTYNHGPVQLLSEWCITGFSAWSTRTNIQKQHRQRSTTKHVNSH